MDDKSDYSVVDVVEELQWILEHPGVRSALEAATGISSFTTASLLALEPSRLGRLLLLTRRLGFAIATGQPTDKRSTMELVDEPAEEPRDEEESGSE